MKRVKKVAPLQFGLFVALFGAVFGLAWGLVYSFGGLIFDALITLDWIASNESPGLSEGTGLAFLSLLVMPLIGVAVGLFVGFIGAWLYNRWLNRLFNLKIDLE